MEKNFVISVPGGLTRTGEILELNRRIRALGKPVVLQTYDAVQGLKWNGGRLVMNTLMEDFPMKRMEILSDSTVGRLPEVLEKVRRLNDEGIAFNLTINNVLESVDVENEEGNFLLERLENGQNWVTVSTHALSRHIRANYPRFQQVASICFTYSKLEEYRKACAGYELVVAMPFMAYQPEVLRKLPVEKLSFIINDDCALFCRRREHYEQMSRCNMVGNSTREEQERNVIVGGCLYRSQPGYRDRIPQGCEGNPGLFHKIARRAQEQRKASAPHDRLPGGKEFNITSATRKELIQMGLTHFKLQGREKLDFIFQPTVTDFLETFVRDEL